MKGTLLFDNALSPITVCQDFFLVISMNVQCKWFLGYILKCCVCFFFVCISGTLTSLGLMQKGV